MKRRCKSVEAEVQRIAHMPLRDLRSEWERRYGDPPRHRSAELLRRVLAWRVQADAYGGFDAATRRLIEKDAPPKLAAVPGMRLAREWAGRRHEVVVIESGVVYQGETYKSLTEVACHITGIRWNGPRFFGLRQEAKR
jgi:hypothetical protein